MEYEIDLRHSSVGGSLIDELVFMEQLQLGHKNMWIRTTEKNQYSRKMRVRSSFEKF